MVGVGVRTLPEDVVWGGIRGKKGTGVVAPVLEGTGEEDGL